MLRVLKLLFNVIMWIISFLVPKSKKYVLIGGWQGKRFADNSRGMFEYLDSHKDEIGIKRVFWYTKDKGIYQELKELKKDVLYGYQIRSIFWHLRSKVHMIDQSTKDIIAFLSIRSIRINLWHGIPLKKIGNYINPGSINWNRKMFSVGCWPDQYLLVTSEITGQMLTYAMGIKKEKCLIASYPRNARLFGIEEKKRKKDDPFLIFYLPTFRDIKDQNPIFQMDLAAFNKRLSERNMILYVKPHFASMASWDQAKKFSNISILNATEDVYDWLYKTDLLITDYSSVFFDFMITKRAILFYPYDLEYYEEKERGFAMPYDENTPGDKVFTAEELEERIFYIKENYAQYIEKHKENYDYVNIRMNKYLDEPNYEEILQFWN